ncbi:TRP-domain-containing protein [Venturia nashicola]|uniref:TRP-domain-containing protein n=1 Tax=Venturia nashicola TaxID=86259 RepID=A0A4Z1NU93_9PEZI|nr:TRP-domain-containing protein [Venturia nashicola]TLD29988.1 TRP-domain-containing protein [Venturia nashicola]
MIFLPTPWPIPALSLLLTSLTILPQARADDVQTITYQNPDGSALYLQDDRRPALYTGNFGDCLGDPANLITVTKFDASYYKDNMTITFDIQGSTTFAKEALMIYIGVYAYGESRFEIPFDPCKANIYSMCPAKQNISINANAQIPLGASDVALIPSIALSIPDFEGQAILRIFANSTQSEVACYAATLKNGATFSHPEAVGSTLGVFTLIALLASFATAAYGETIPTMRKHYAHSLSVLVVFAVFHHIFFTGALSMNFPSVLVAFWSNYAWSAGMIYTSGMQNSIDRLTSKARGNTLYLGAAGVGTDQTDVGGGYDFHKIYKRSQAFDPDGISEALEGTLSKVLTKRATTGSNSTSVSKWFGDQVRAGLPLPGNYSGFAGTLSEEMIPASNAFLTGFLWFLILILIVGGSIVLFKFALDLLCRFNIVKTQRFNLFRAHWKGYTALALLRTCFIAFFTIMFLTIFQFSYGGAASVMAIAAIVFVIFFVGIVGLCAYACYYRLRVGNFQTKPDRIQLERRKILKVIPWYTFHHESDVRNQPEKVFSGSLPGWKISHVGDDAPQSVHEDEEYIKKFGWLASRYRRTKWWFFAIWVFYEFIRAAVLAGASGHPMVQVFFLLVIEFIAFLGIVKLKPFEGQRLNVIVIYILGFSKIVCVALSAAFDVSFNLARIPTTVIGIVIIVIQGLLTVALLICIVLSAISSYFSVTRHREDIKPRRWIPLRERYFKHLDQVVADVPPPPKPPTPPPEEPKGPYFSVNSVKRAPKIEDEDAEFQAEILQDPRMYQTQIGSVYGSSEEVLPGNRASRALSVGSRFSSTTLPYAARVHRASWSTRDLQDHNRPYTAGTGAPLVGEDGDIARPGSLMSRASRDSFGQIASGRQSVADVTGAGLPVRPDSSYIYKMAPTSPPVSRPASTGLDGVMVPSSSGTPVNSLPRPTTPSLTRSPSLHDDTTAGTPPSPRIPGGSLQRGRSRLMKTQKPKESIDEISEL